MAVGGAFPDQPPSTDGWRIVKRQRSDLKNGKVEWSVWYSHDEPREHGGDHCDVGGVATAPRPPRMRSFLLWRRIEQIRNARVERPTHTAPSWHLAAEIARRYDRLC